MNREIRPIHYWNYARLKSREQFEINQGRFGNVKLLEDVMQYSGQEDDRMVEDEEDENENEQDSNQKENEAIGIEVIILPIYILLNCE